jgi:DNA-binding PadR family transcriptional regulator
MKVNPRDFLGGQSPRERYLQNRRLAVDWIYRCGFTSAQNLRLCLKKESASWASIAVARGLLRSTKTESGEPAVIYTLTESGLELAHHHATKLLPYPELDPYRVNQGKLRHDLLVQKLSLAAMRDGAILSVTTEREINEGDQKGQKRADAIWHLTNGQKLGIEIELSAKWGRKLDEFITSIAGSLDPARPEGRLDGFVVITDSEAICSRYRESMRPGQPMRRWRKNARQHWVVEEEDVVPEWLSELVDFRVIEG